MKPHLVRNPVPTPEQMANILGVSPERLAKLREIMGVPLTKAGTKRAKWDVRAAQKPAPESKPAKLDAKGKGARGKSAPR